MKTLTISLIVLFTALYCQADTFTCSSHPLGGSQFTFLSDAYLACAASGDTILLENSPITYYLSITNSWDKSITVIGIGGNPEISDQHETKISTLGNLNQIFGSGNQFHGIIFLEEVKIIVGADDISFENCRFKSELIFQDGPVLLISSNISFINTIFENVDEPNVVVDLNILGNMHFLNCIFNGYILGNGGTGHVILIDHCMFINNIQFSSHIVDLRNATIINSIFLNSAEVNFNTLGCTFQNNIFDDDLVMPPAGNFGAGNITNVTPIFSNYIVGNDYSTDHNYALDPSSPGVGSATDDTDIGVHGGLTRFNEALEPSIVPIVTSLEVVGGGAEAGETINVIIQARQPLPE